MSLLDDLNGVSPEPTQCAHVSRRGNRCKYPPVVGEDLCAIHCASLARAQEMSQRRMIAIQDEAITTLQFLNKHSEDDRVRLGAANSICDRSGLGTKSTVSFDDKSDLEKLSEEELAQRAERLVRIVRERKPETTH